LFYHSQHLWVNFVAEVATVGLTNYAQQKLEEIVLLELPSPQESVKKEEEIGFIESAKSVSALISPLTGRVVEVNEELKKNPQRLNEISAEKIWFYKMVPTKWEEEKTSLLSPSQYQEFLKNLSANEKKEMASYY
jgi:glycine cleavage system H protein